MTMKGHIQDKQRHKIFDNVQSTKTPLTPLSGKPPSGKPPAGNPPAGNPSTRTPPSGSLTDDATNSTQIPLSSDIALKQLIHDTNNALMLIGIAGEQISSLAMHEPAHTQTQTQQIAEVISRNVLLIRNLLLELTHLSTHDNRPLRSANALTYADCLPFLQSQQVEWELIALPGTSIAITIAPFVGHITASFEQLSRVFQNLVRNASEAFRDEGRLLTISLTIQQEADMLCWHFRDNGPGIAACERDTLFAPAISSKQTSDMPVGYGLATVKTLVVQMGGDIKLVNSAGEGAYFVLSFPLIHDKNAPQ